jgi:four helix bundle protein
MSGMTDLVLYQKHYDLMLYALPLVNRFPASQRFILGQKIEVCMLDIACLIVRAQKSRQYRKARLFDIDVALEELRLLVRLAKDLGYISHKRYGLFCERVDEIGKILGGWLKSA